MVQHRRDDDRSFETLAALTLVSETHEMSSREMNRGKEERLFDWTDLVCKENFKLAYWKRCVHFRVHVHDGTRFVFLPRAKTAYSTFQMPSLPQTKRKSAAFATRGTLKSRRDPGMSTAGRANVADCMH